MNENSTYYTDLITRYYSGEITAAELRLLSDWLKANPVHVEFFRQYQKTWELIEKQKITSTVNTDAEWIALQLKMNSPAEKDKTKVRFSVFHGRYNLKFPVQTIWNAAAAITILLVSSFLLYFYISKPGDIIITAQASNQEQVLPDGSVVSLRAGSLITYPQTFASNKRIVELKGEAYFKVAHDKTKPFIVKSGDARIEVLGTQFNVNTNSTAGNLEVVLTNGKVSVYYKAMPGKNVILAPGEKALLLADRKQIIKSANTDPNYMAWKTRVLVFDNETLARVAATLQNVYQTPVKIVDSQLSACRVTVSFNDQSLESVLQVICETLDLQVKQGGNGFELSGKGCK